ncbi:NADH:ubiquinone oxidoreductase [Steccherinum ochraceum]|uniref:NADH:ubiquinone oxidoreductase n=1 Tax=Steccherinum ochraceum TaxID=92696 RepID=A0A4R0RRU5_9APHY|nr:NADH:ubiquinone oxidoreductase [Steccherinum ochraceum]
MASLDDNKYCSHPTCSSDSEWKAKYQEVADMLSETRAELDDFHVSSKELEEELERELERTEKAQHELKIKAAKAENERDDWKSKFMSLQTNHNTTTTSLQRELDTLRQDHQKTKIQLRELEMGNDDLERNERAIASSLADVEQKYSRVLEEKILLEHELLDKASIEEETQRLKDELRDANEEITILKEQLLAASQRAVVEIPPSSNASVASHDPSDEESLLSTAAPPDLQLSDLTPPDVPIKDSPFTPKPVRPRVFTSEQARLHRAGFHPPKTSTSHSTPPSSIPSPLTRSTTVPSWSGTPSRLPPRTPSVRPTPVNRNASMMSSTSTITSTTAKSRGVQMVSEMRARVKVLEQKIHTRVPRLRMGSVTGRTTNANVGTPRTAHAGVAASPAPSTSSSSLRSTSHSTSHSTAHSSSHDDRDTTLKARKPSAELEKENQRTPGGDASGWVLIMEDTPSPVKDKEKERRRTSSPSAPSAFRPLTMHSASPSPSSIPSRAPSSLSQSVVPSGQRRPTSRLSTSTEGRSSISTNATTSTSSSIPTPTSRPTTPTFLPIPSSGMYSSAQDLKRSMGPGVYPGKRTSFGNSNTSSPMSPPSSLPTYSSSPQVRSSAAKAPSAKLLGQSRIGRPVSGGISGRKSVGEGDLSDTGGVTSKYGRSRAGSASALFGRKQL